MIDKRFPFIYSVLFGFLASMIILMILLFIEYRFFCNQARELIELKQQYAQYVDVLNKKTNGNVLDDNLELSHSISNDVVENVIEDNNTDEFLEESPLAIKEIMAAEASDAPDDDDDYVDESFVVINRHPDYLKQSTLDYIESQDLNALMTSIDIDRWSDDSEHVVAPSIKKPVTQRKPASITNRAVTQQTPKMSVMRRPMKDCGFVWPIDADKFWLSSLFGPRKRIDGTWGFHHGIDMAAVKGTIVKAARAGTVTEACFQTGYGNTIVVQHTETLKTRYAHLHAIRVCAGQKIKQGTIIGTVGETGFIRKKGKDGSHLHFEVYERGKRINPMHCLPRT